MFSQTFLSFARSVLDTSSYLKNSSADFEPFFLKQIKLVARFVGPFDLVRAKRLAAFRRGRLVLSTRISNPN